MRIPCPLCGPRDRREFYYYGSADYLDRPAPAAPPEAWDDYLHNRDNPAGETRDLWYHEMGCASWIEVQRNTVTHEVLAARLVEAQARFRSKFVYEEGDLREIAEPPAKSRKPRAAAKPGKARA